MFYLIIRDDRINDIRYHTNGCGNTRLGAKRDVRISSHLGGLDNHKRRIIA